MEDTLLFSEARGPEPRALYRRHHPCSSVLSNCKPEPESPEAVPIPTIPAPTVPRHSRREKGGGDAVNSVSMGGLHGAAGHVPRADRDSSWPGTHRSTSASVANSVMCRQAQSSTPFSSQHTQADRPFSVLQHSVTFTSRGLVLSMPWQSGSGTAAARSQ
jgi:hypothetical protein